jgi:hypothetical protein
MFALNGITRCCDYMDVGSRVTQEQLPRWQGASMFALNGMSRSHGCEKGDNVQDGLSQTSCLSCYEFIRHKIIRQRYITITLPLLAFMALILLYLKENKKASELNHWLFI